MATTINSYISRVKLITAATLSELETAVNGYITGDDAGLETGEYVLSIDIDFTTVRDVPTPISQYVATLSIAGSTTTE